MYLKKYITAIAVLLLLIAVFVFSELFGQGNGDFTLRWGGFFSGGGRTESAEFKIKQSAIGGLAVGRSENDAYILTAGIGAPKASKRVNVRDVTIQCGKGRVFISVDNATGIAGIDVTLTYDAGLLEALNVKETEITSGFWLDKNLTKPGKVIISMAHSTGITSGTDVNLIEIVFQATSPVQSGTTTPLHFERILLYDEHSQKFPAIPQDGAATILPTLLGDVSGNGAVTAFDAALMLQAVVGLITLPSPAYPCFTIDIADVTGDGTLSALDAAYILQASVGLITLPISTASPAMVASNIGHPRFTIPNQSIQAGRQVNIPIQLSASEGVFAGELVLDYDSALLNAIKVTTPSKEPDCSLKSNLAKDEIKIAFAISKSEPNSDVIANVEFLVSPDVTAGTVIPLTMRQITINESHHLPIVVGHIEVLPKETQLLANYPNPFNPETWIPYQLAEPEDVKITIYNAAGQRVRQLDLGYKPAGVYLSKEKSAYWNGKNDLGEQVASGVYFYTLRAGDRVVSRKMSLLK